MAKTKFELNKAGVRELMLSPEMESALESIAGDALTRLGDGYDMNTYHGRNRINVEVSAETFTARRDNAQNNTILKAVQG